MEYGIAILSILLISINILLMTLITTYKNTIKCVKRAIENIYDKIEDNERIIKVYYEDFHKKTNQLIIDVNKIKNNTERLIDYQKTIIIIDKSILKSLSKDSNYKNINDKNINNENKNGNKSKPYIEYLKEISDNICLVKIIY